MSLPSGVTAVMVTFPLKLPASMSSWVVVTICVQVKTGSAGQSKAAPSRQRQQHVHGGAEEFAESTLQTFQRR